MLDQLPPWGRHLALMLMAALLSWAGTDLVPILQGRPGLAAALAPVIGIAVTTLTPLVRSYGIGARRGPDGKSGATP